MRLLSLAAIFALVLASCTKEEVPSELSDLNTRVQNATSLMSHLDSTTIEAGFSKVEPYYMHLKTSEFDSTLKDIYIYDQTWMDRYSRAIYKWRSQARLNEVKLAESTTQIADLIHDIENGLLDSTQIRTFIRQEQLEIAGVLDHVETRGGEIQFYAAGADSMATRLDSIFPDIK